MTAMSATSARANLYRLIDQVNEESQPLTITGQRGNAVLIVGGREIVPGGGQVAARWRSVVLPGGGQEFCPR